MNQPVKNFFTFPGTQRFITVITSTHHKPYPGPHEFKSAFLHPVSSISLYDHLTIYAYASQVVFSLQVLILIFCMNFSSLPGMLQTGKFTMSLTVRKYEPYLCGLVCQHCVCVTATDNWADGMGTYLFVSHFLLQTELTWTQHLCEMYSVESWVLICHTLAKCTSWTEFNQSFVNKYYKSQVSGPV